MLLYTDLINKYLTYKFLFCSPSPPVLFVLAVPPITFFLALQGLVGLGW